MKNKLILKPSTENLNEILNWLKDELQNSSDGFYQNKRIIESSINEKRMICYGNENNVVGFLCYTKKDKLISIDIFCIKVDKRGLKIGSEFYYQLERNFKRRKIIGLNLYCEPSKSEKFWKKQGFIKTDLVDEHPLAYWKPIIERASCIDKVDDGNKIELWNCEPHYAKINKPKWVWNIAELKYDIIEYINSEWLINITKNGILIFDNKCKRLPDELLIEYKILNINAESIELVKK